MNYFDAHHVHSDVIEESVATCSCLVRQFVYAAILIEFRN